MRALGAAAVVLAVVLGGGNEASANVTVESMSYANFAREAADTRMRNQIEADKYRIDSAKTQWSYDTDLRLLPSNSVSWFETQLTYMQLIREKFYVDYYTGLAADAQVRENIWHLRATTAEAGVETPALPIAQDYVELREDNLAVSHKLLDWATKTAAAARDLRIRSQWAFSQGAVTQEELNYYITLDELGEGLVTWSTAEVDKAEKLLAEAKGDLAQVVAHGPALPPAQ